MKNYKRSLKNFGNGLKGAGIYFVGMGMLANPVIFPVGMAAVIKGGKELYKSAQGDYIENSMIMVQRNNVINRILKQPSNYIVEGIPTTNQFLEAYLTENKMDFLMMQEVNMFLQLDSKDTDGSDIIYNTLTHAGNYKMLQELEKAGMIEDLQKVFKEKKSLAVARLALGNSNSKQMTSYRKRRIGQIRENIKNQKGFGNKVKILKEELNEGIDKKTKMYDISFKKTDKVFNEQEIGAMLSFIRDNRGVIDAQKFNIIKDKNGNIKSILYKKEYVTDMLKRRSIKVAKKIKEKTVGNKENIKESLKKMTVAMEDIVKNNKESNLYIESKSIESKNVR